MSDEAATLRKTPLNAVEHELGGKMVDFGRWELPVQFSGILDEEHAAVREHVGLFDVSHMGELTIKEPEALMPLQLMTGVDLGSIGITTSARWTVDDVPGDSNNQPGQVHASKYQQISFGKVGAQLYSALDSREPSCV